MQLFTYYVKKKDFVIPILIILTINENISLINIFSIINSIDGSFFYLFQTTA